MGNPNPMKKYTLIQRAENEIEAQINEIRKEPVPSDSLEFRNGILEGLRLASRVVADLRKDEVSNDLAMLIGKGE